MLQTSCEPPYNQLSDGIGRGKITPYAWFGGKYTILVNTIAAQRHPLDTSAQGPACIRTPTAARYAVFVTHRPNHVRIDLDPGVGLIWQAEHPSGSLSHARDHTVQIKLLGVDLGEHERQHGFQTGQARRRRVAILLHQ